MMEVNKKRKFAQMQASNDICKSYAKTQDLIHKNILLEQELIKLRKRDGEIVGSQRQKIE